MAKSSTISRIASMFAKADSKKVLIFIVSYFAEKHIEAVLERIPTEIRNSENVHILCIDDGSGDQSAKVASEWANRLNYKNVTVFRNPVNQGYGGNQKLGYRFAIENGFDLVILLHGDGQYAPELLPKFIEEWQKSKADVFLGSRMHSLKSAQKGGMPLYKIAGNRVLTTIQNVMTGNTLSEYHTGYRAYSTDFLKRVPFELNTNDFHFDTEILLQAFNVKAKLVELQIPTYYGDEICRVDGMRYAKDVVLATMQYRLQQLGMFCSLKYQTQSKRTLNHEERYTAHAKVAEILRGIAPKKVLDLGCGQGTMAARCTEFGAQVTGIDSTMPDSISEFERFFMVDIENDALPVDPFSFEAVLMLDVLEQLTRPEQVLLKMRNNTNVDLLSTRVPKLIVTTPNVAFATIRLNLLFGRFNYGDRGILNIDHKRLFTMGSLKSVLQDCGYTVDEIYPIGAPFELVMPGKLGKALAWMSTLLARSFPSLFAFQFMLVCHPRPGVKQLLHKTEKYLVGNGLAHSILR